MKITKAAGDTAVLKELGERVSQARLRRNLSQQELAYEAGISKRTLERMEAGESTQLSTLVRILRALALLDRLELLLPEELPSPIEELKRQGKQRQRASKTHQNESASEPWTWANDNEDHEQ